MAKRVYCDGCDTEITSGVHRKEISVRMDGADGRPIVQAVYDLCECCHRQLLERSDPKNWHRINAAA